MKKLETALWLGLAACLGAAGALTYVSAKQSNQQGSTSPVSVVPIPTPTPIPTPREKRCYFAMSQGGKGFGSHFEQVVETSLPCDEVPAQLRQEQPDFGGWRRTRCETVGGGLVTQFYDCGKGFVVP